MRHFCFLQSNRQWFLGLGWLTLLLMWSLRLPAQPVAKVSSAPAMLLRPAAVFDGYEKHLGWAVLVENGRIAAAGLAGRGGGV